MKFKVGDQVVANPTMFDPTDPYISVIRSLINPHQTYVVVETDSYGNMRFAGIDLFFFTPSCWRLKSTFQLDEI